MTSNHRKELTALRAVAHTARSPHDTIERSLSGSVVLNALLNWMLANDIDPARSKR